jgi:hypothetical protein
LYISQSGNQGDRGNGVWVLVLKKELLNGMEMSFKKCLKNMGTSENFEAADDRWIDEIQLYG